MRASSDQSFGILIYHRISPLIAGFSEPTWNVAPDRLGRQLSGLMARGYHPWPLRRAIECRQAGETIPARTFVVTFDDGYDNVYHNALPVLKELSVPATVFITTAYLDADRPFAFDDWLASGSAAAPEIAWKPLSADHCREMLDSGLIEIGSHTHTHADLRGRPEMFQHDLTRSLAVLRERFGLSDATFAFPYGYYGPKMVAAARLAGAKCSLTADPRPVAPGQDPFSWGRFNVERYDNPYTLSLKLNGWYSMLRAVWLLLRPKTPIYDNRPISSRYHLALPQGSARA